MAIEEKLALVRYRVDRIPHITVDASRCQACPHHGCLVICPAGCFSSHNGALVFSYEGCLECGACAVICDRRAVHWGYPRGGFGVCYRLV